MKIIGITGSIGCGKTFLADIIKKIGFSVYNPDVWTRELYNNKDFIKVIKENFSQCFQGENFNKRMLRELVFNDNRELKKLENIIHPFLYKRLKNIIHKYAVKEDLLFIDVALLYEFGWDKYCDYVITADADEKTQMERVIKRDGISVEDFYKIVAVQMPQKEKKYYADFVINTCKSENILKKELIKFIEEIL